VQDLQSAPQFWADVDDMNVMRDRAMHEMIALILYVIGL